MQRLLKYTKTPPKPTRYSKKGLGDTSFLSEDPEKNITKKHRKKKTLKASKIPTPQLSEVSGIMTTNDDLKVILDKLVKDRLSDRLVADETLGIIKTIQTDLLAVNQKVI